MSGVQARAGRALGTSHSDPGSVSGHPMRMQHALSAAQGSINARAEAAAWGVSAVPQGGGGAGGGAGGGKDGGNRGGGKGSGSKDSKPPRTVPTPPDPPMSNRKQKKADFVKGKIWGRKAGSWK